MGWISLASQKTTETAPLENRKNISDADIDRVGEWAANAYFPNGVAVGDGTFRPPTADEVHTALTEAIYADIKQRTERWFLAQAEAAARATVKPISLTSA